jgi:hypothetical protein
MDYTFLIIFHVIALVRIVIINVINYPNNKEYDGVRLRVENDRLRSGIGYCNGKLKLKTSDSDDLTRKNVLNYLLSKRLAILAIHAMCDLTNEQTAKRFQVTGQLRFQETILP